MIERIFLSSWSEPSHRGATLLDIDQTEEGNITNCIFSDSAIGTQGRRSQSHRSFSTNVAIRGNEFFQIGLMPLSGGGESWLIQSNTFEPLVDGSAGAFSSRVGGTEVSSRGRTFSGNWFGDSSPAGTWIEWKDEGLMFTGNTVGRVRALRFLAGTQGETIQGNAFNANIVAIDFGVDLSVGGGFVMGNSFYQCTTSIRNAHGQHSLFIGGNAATAGPAGSLPDVTEASLFRLPGPAGPLVCHSSGPG